LRQNPSIYKWFQEDFCETDQDVLKHLLQYASQPLAAKLASASRIGDYDYDWRLNDVMR
jgi:hypothetical protein